MTVLAVVAPFWIQRHVAWVIGTLIVGAIFCFFMAARNTMAFRSAVWDKLKHIVPPPDEVKQIDDSQLLEMALEDCRKALNGAIRPVRNKYLKYLSSVPNTSDEPSYPDSVRFGFQNQWDTEIEVWGPVWESNDVHMHPLINCLTIGDEKPAPSIIVPSSRPFSFVANFSSPLNRGIQIRLGRTETGTLVFPIKIEGKLVSEKIDV